MHAAARPFRGEPLLSTAASESPKTQNMRSSGEPMLNIIGRRIGMLTPSNSAPHSPPMTDAVNAAPNARPASPLRAIG